MATLQTLSTAAPRTRRTMLPIAMLVALVVAAAGVVVIAGGGSDTARTESQLPAHVITHGGAPVPDLSAMRPSYPRFDALPAWPTPTQAAPGS